MRGACVWWGGGGERAGGVRVWVCVRGGVMRMRPRAVTPLPSLSLTPIGPRSPPRVRPSSDHARARTRTHTLSLCSRMPSRSNLSSSRSRPHRLKVCGRLPLSSPLLFFARSNPTHHASHHRLLRPRPRLRGRRLRARLVPAHQGPRRPGARPERRAPRPPGRPPAALGRPVSGWRPAPRLGRRRPARAPGPHPL